MATPGNPFIRDAAAPPFYESAIAITPANSNIVSPSGQEADTKALIVGGAGNLVVIMADGTGPITIAIPATACGVILPLRVLQVTTATTATGVVALY